MSIVSYPIPPLGEMASDADQSGSGGMQAFSRMVTTDPLFEFSPLSLRIGEPRHRNSAASQSKEANSSLFPPILSPNHHRRIPTAPDRRSLTQPNYALNPIVEKPVPFFPPPEARCHRVEQDQVTALLPTAFNDEFMTFCSDKGISFNPSQLGFIPKPEWSDEEVSFGDLVSRYFRCDDSPRFRFSFKLYNALQIAKSDPFYVEIIGVEWLNLLVMKVNLVKFGRLLGIQNIERDLLKPPGCFAAHGFVEINETSAHNLFKDGEIEDVDYKTVVLLQHQDSMFTEASTEADIVNARWKTARRKHSRGTFSN